MADTGRGSRPSEFQHEGRGFDLNDPAALDHLRTLAEALGDAISVTDPDSRVVAWNPTAEALYGIDSGDAIGLRIYDLFDSSIVGQPLAQEEPRRITIETGVWRGRTIDVPRIGRRAGQEVIVEAVLNRLTDDAAAFSGIISIKRDITETVRLERELAALGSLASATGRARSVEELARRAIETLAEATGASTGLILGVDRGEPRELASHAMPPEAVALIGSPALLDSPLVRAVGRPGTVVSRSTDAFPMREESRTVLEAAGIRSIAAVGLHRDDELVGLLILGWDGADRVRPSSAMFLQAAAHLERALANADLVADGLRRAAGERAFVRRLETLHELTSVGFEVATPEALAERSARLVNEALGANGTAFGLFNPDRSGYGVRHAVNLAAPLLDWLQRNPPTDRRVVNHWLAGGGSVLAGFDPSEAGAEAIAVAAAAGVSAYAAIPLRIDGRLVGGIVAYFSQPAEVLPIQDADLDAVGRIASIALSNLELRTRLVASEGRYRTLFERSPVPFVLETLDGHVGDVNEAALALYAADRDWLVGRSVDDISEWDRGELERRRIEMAATGRGTFRGTGIRADGTRFPQEVHASTVDVDGETRVLIRVDDLTERDRLQRELVQAQKMEAIGQLVAGVAHELNNPLASIVAFSQLMRRDPRLPEDMRQDADLLVGEADRTRRIVQNLLDFARQRRPERHPTPLRLLVESVLSLQSYSIGAGRIDVAIDMPDDLPLVAVDRAQLQQVLLNLTLNAIQAIRETSAPGTITLAARHADGPDGGIVRLVVADDGPGVAAEHRDLLFVPFFTTKAPGDGTGLGLPVSFGIVAAHGGSLTFEPGPDEHGATFVVTLPVAATDPIAAGESVVAAGSVAGDPSTASPSRAAAAAVEPTAVDAPAVLVLDDEASIRAFLAKALPGGGFAPTVVATGDEAVAAVRARSFAAILCDYRMAGMSGTEVYERIVALRPELAGRFVFMSGDVLNADLASFAETRGVGLLAKPFDIDTVRSTVRAIVDAGPPTA